MCKKDVEKIDHLMLHCHVVKELRNIVFSLFGVHWVIPCSVMFTQKKKLCYGSSS